MKMKVYHVFDDMTAPIEDRSGSSSCPYRSPKRDCDGDTVKICYSNGYCPYKIRKTDCDGDRIDICGYF